MEFEAVDWLFADAVLKGTGGEGVREEIARLMAAARSGHLCIRVQDPSRFPKSMVQGEESPLCLHGDRLYLQKNWQYESRVVEEIRRLQARAVEKVHVQEAPKGLNALQQEALSTACAQGVSLITGGPGTGKTYTAGHILSALVQSGAKRIAVAAPTGKAAAALESSLSKHQVGGVELYVGTVHGLLKAGARARFVITPLAYDLVLIDECSMLDAALFASLLASIRGATRLILMGDPDQLPPVEAGSLFADLIEAGVFATTELQESVRCQSAPLQSLAGALRSGSRFEAPSLGIDFGKRSVDRIYDRLFEAASSKFAWVHAGKVAWEELASFRILSCLRTGPLGVDALNALFVNRFYNAARVGESVVFPILITAKDEELALYNGQMGLLMLQKQEGGSVRDVDCAFVHLEGRTPLPARALPRFEWAFCLSVHKAQGSEYEEVLLLVPPGSENFGKEVLYTAATRAKKKPLHRWRSAHH